MLKKQEILAIHFTIERLLITYFSKRVMPQDRNEIRQAITEKFILQNLSHDETKGNITKWIFKKITDYLNCARGLKITEEVVSFIQQFAKTNIFENFYEETVRTRKKFDVFQSSWIDKISKGEKLSQQEISRLTHLEIQKEVIKKFKYSIITKEEFILSNNHDKKVSSRFDIFIPSEKTAIEICLGNIKNEFFKDVNKGKIDCRVDKLYILSVDYKTGKNFYGLNYMMQPSQMALIKSVQSDVTIIPKQIVNI